MKYTMNIQIMGSKPKGAVVSAVVEKNNTGENVKIKTLLDEKGIAYLEEISRENAYGKVNALSNGVAFFTNDEKLELFEMLQRMKYDVTILGKSASGKANQLDAVLEFENVANKSEKGSNNLPDYIQKVVDEKIAQGILDADEWKRRYEVFRANNVGNDIIFGVVKVSEV